MKVILELSEKNGQQTTEVILEIIALVMQWPGSRHIESIEMRLGRNPYRLNLHFTVLTWALGGKKKILHRVTYMHKLRLGRIPDAEGGAKKMQDLIHKALNA